MHSSLSSTLGGLRKRKEKNSTIELIHIKGNLKCCPPIKISADELKYSRKHQMKVAKRMECKNLRENKLV